MATTNNVVAAVLDNTIQISGTNVTFQLQVMTDTGRNFTMQVTAPISDTTGQLDGAIFTAIQNIMPNFGDTMPANASLMVLGGKT